MHIKIVASLTALYAFSNCAMESQKIILQANNKKTAYSVPKEHALSSKTLRDMLEETTETTIPLDTMDGSTLKLLVPYFALAYKNDTHKMQAALNKHTPAKLVKLVKAFNYFNMPSVLPESIKALACKLSKEECLEVIVRSPHGTHSFQLPPIIDKIVAQEMLKYVSIEKALAQPLAQQVALKKVNFKIATTKEDVLKTSLSSLPRLDSSTHTCISDDGTLLAVVENRMLENRRLTIYNLVTNTILKQFKNITNPLIILRFHADQILDYRRMFLIFLEFRTPEVYVRAHNVNFDDSDSSYVITIPTYPHDSMAPPTPSKWFGTYNLVGSVTKTFLSLHTYTSGKISSIPYLIPEGEPVANLSSDHKRIIVYAQNSHPSIKISSTDLFNVEEKKYITPLRDTTIACHVFSPHSTYIATGSWDGTLKIWSAETGTLLDTIRAHGQSITSVCFSPDDHLIATSSNDRSIKIIDRKTKKIINQITLIPLVDRITFNPAQLIARYNVKEQLISNLQFSADGSYVICRTQDAFHVWLPFTNEHFSFPEINSKTFLTMSKDASIILYQGKNGIEKIDLSQLPIKKWRTQMMSSSQVALFHYLSKSSENNTALDHTTYPGIATISQTLLSTQASWWDWIKKGWNIVHADMLTQ